MYITETKIFKNSKAIVYNSQNKLAIYSVNQSGNDLQPELDGLKKVPEGSFVAGVGSGNSYKTRFLPRTRLSAATNGTANISVSSPNNQFLVGDVLYAKNCYAKTKLLGTFATADVVTGRIDGVNYTATVGATQTAAAAAALFVSTNSAALAAKDIVVTASGAAITVYASDSHDIYFTTSGADSQAVIETTIPGFLGDNITPLGTILAVGLPNATTGVRTITLAGNVAYALPSKAIVGIDVVEVLGLFPEAVDYTNEPLRHLGVISQIGGVYKINLPYIDKQLLRLFDHDLYIKDSFYRN